MNSSSHPIKFWDPEDRPREKMREKGKDALSNAELLAILIGSGSRHVTALALAKKLLASVQNLDDLGKRSLDHFTAFKGIGEVKSITIAAALELGRRRQVESVPIKSKITTSGDAYNMMASLLEDLHHEEFWIACLNRRNQVISKERISLGGISATVVDPKILFKIALSLHASSLILYHNHPSGSTEPSKEDFSITQKLKKGGDILDIKVLDHIIIGNGTYYSFADEGTL